MIAHYDHHKIIKNSVMRTFFLGPKRWYKYIFLIAHVTLYRSFLNRTILHQGTTAVTLDIMSHFNSLSFSPSYCTCCVCVRACTSLCVYVRESEREGEREGQRYSYFTVFPWQPFLVTDYDPAPTWLATSTHIKETEKNLNISDAEIEWRQRYDLKIGKDSNISTKVEKKQS